MQAGGSRFGQTRGRVDGGVVSAEQEQLQTIRRDFWKRSREDSDCSQELASGYNAAERDASISEWLRTSGQVTEVGCRCS